jgi:integration host factor subunit alpha
MMKTITRTDLSNKLRADFGLTAADSAKLVDLVFEEISESLIRGEEVKIAGLGTFKILAKAPRIGRNPKTGAPAIISARRVPSFKPSAEFRKKVAK